jgi:hypothetical protein
MEDRRAPPRELLLFANKRDSPDGAGFPHWHRFARRRWLPTFTSPAGAGFHIHRGAREAHRWRVLLVKTAIGSGPSSPAATPGHSKPRPPPGCPRSAMPRWDALLRPLLDDGGGLWRTGGCHPANFFCSRTKEIRQTALAPTFELHRTAKNVYFSCNDSIPSGNKPWRILTHCGRCGWKRRRNPSVAPGWGGMGDGSWACCWPG